MNRILKKMIGTFAMLIMLGAVNMNAQAADGLQVQVEEHSITLEWTADESVEYYRVFDQNGEVVSEEDIVADDAVAGRISYAIADVKCSKEVYTYTVRGYKLDEESAEEVLVWETSASAEVWSELEAPVISSAKFTKAKQVSVVWSAVDNAGSYNIYRKKGTGSWKQIGTTEGTSYVDKNVALGTIYRYSVQAVSSCCGNESAFDTTGKKATQLGITKITSAKVLSSGKIKVTWNKVSGAKGYYVYAMIDSGNWKKIADTASASCTYGLSKSNWGKKISFKVYPYCSEYRGLVSNIKTVIFQPQKVVLTKVRAVSYTTNKVFWEKVANVSGYKIYRKIEGRSWKCIATVTGSQTLNYADKTAELGQEYYYTVKAFWKSGSKTELGYYDSKGLAVKTTLGTPTLVSAKASGEKIVVKWNKVSGAKGYRIYRKAEGSSEWKQIATVSGNETLTYKESVPKATIKYSYTVKAYRKEDGTTYWSKYNKTGKSVRANVGIVYKTVKDKDSAMYGKTLKLYYNQKGKQLQNVEKYVGKKSTYYLYINKSKQYVTAYCIENGYYIPIRTMICSTGKVMSHTPNGTYHTLAKYRWHTLNGPCWGQYCTRIVGGVLFHSIFYRTYNDPTDLAKVAYNKLGTPASHGCVRLNVEGAKWIYDNCKIGTTVVIHAKDGYEPMKKPTNYKVGKNHGWDPTDPNEKWRCKEKGCHDYAK